MELVNNTGMAAGHTLGLDPDGRECLVVAVKGTFDIPPDRREATLAAEQQPLVEADVFTGDPGFSAPLYECDYAPRKPRCDVLLNGTAHAPRGRPVRRMEVGLRVAGMAKSFVVVGEREWRKRLWWVGNTQPARFTRSPISYDVAFGGVDHVHKDPKRHRTCLANHVGIGFHHVLASKAIHGRPLPRTEEKGKPVRNPRGRYRPMSFGPVGRAWQPRVKLAGTYDQHWVDEISPFLPPDFRDDYYQSAPPDQQISHPSGGEEVTLLNLTPQGSTRFLLPRVDIPVEFFLRDDDPVEAQAVADTIVIEPDLGRLMITWRASHPIRLDLFEVEQVVAGRMPPGWYRARETGKTHFVSLAELALTPRNTGDIGDEDEDDEQEAWVPGDGEEPGDLASDDEDEDEAEGEAAEDEERPEPPMADPAGVTSRPS